MANIRRILHFRRNRRQRKRKTFRRTRDFNPLDGLTEQEIFERYRFRRETILYVLNWIRPHISSATRRSMAVSPLLQLLAALRFYATGAFWRLIGDSLCLSAATVHKCVHRVSRAIVVALTAAYIKFPTLEESPAIKRAFHEKSGFPNVVGAVDGTFIRIQAPSENEGDFVNRKGYHSLNIQMTCDANYKITSCVAKWPGSVHDSRMFRESSLCRKFENGTYKGILVGDSAYPCKTFLMTPYINPDDESKQRYNRALSLARVLIEQTFGILKRRFSCLHSGLRVRPDKACWIVVSCVVLHNVGIVRRDILDTDDIFPNEVNDDVAAADDDDLHIHQNVNSGTVYRDFIRQTNFMF